MERHLIWRWHLAVQGDRQKAAFCEKWAIRPLHLLPPEANLPLPPSAGRADPARSALTTFPRRRLIFLFTPPPVEQRASPLEYSSSPHAHRHTADKSARRGRPRPTGHQPPVGPDPARSAHSTLSRRRLIFLFHGETNHLLPLSIPCIPCNPWSKTLRTTECTEYTE